MSTVGGRRGRRKFWQEEERTGALLRTSTVSRCHHLTTGTLTRTLGRKRQLFKNAHCRCIVIVQSETNMVHWPLLKYAYTDEKSFPASSESPSTTSA